MKRWCNEHPGAVVLILVGVLIGHWIGVVVASNAHDRSLLWWAWKSLIGLIVAGWIVSWWERTG